MEQRSENVDDQPTLLDVFRPDVAALPASAEIPPGGAATPGVRRRRFSVCAEARPPLFSPMNPLPEDAKYAERSGPIIRLDTERGSIYLQLFPDVAPKHCERIVKLVEEGFYNGVRFHRIVPKFVAQIGDPNSRTGVDAPGVGSGGSPYPNLPLEVSRAYANERGVLAMARKNDPNSANSQFYIVLEKAPHLDMQYTVFGRVADNGMAIVDQIQRGDAVSMHVIKRA